MTNTITHSSEDKPVKRFKSLERLLDPNPTLSLHSCSSHGRKVIESYIAQQFNLIHGATIHHFMPHLLSINCNKQPISALGLRPAENQSLFLEQYLPRSIESFVRKAAGDFVKRHQIAEIGNLVSTYGGSSQMLFVLLTAFLQLSKFEWVVFTATPQIHKMMSRMGMEFYELYDADPALLKNSHISEWGSYYDSQPKVVTVKVDAAMLSLCQRKIYTKVISLYQSRIKTLAKQLDMQSINEQFTLTA